MGGSNMAYVILFGGGDGGGLILTEHGIKPIPPWNPFDRAQLRALGALVSARAAAGAGRAAKDLDTVIATLNRSVTDAATKEFGSLGNGGLLYADGEDGVYCGSTGPIHVPFHRGGPGPVAKPG
jgi:hypothetical protein